MDYKETIMTRNGFEGLTFGKEVWELISNLLEFQAEVSFDMGKVEGRKYVVECTIFTTMTGEVQIRELFERTEKGKAQLKEWGL